MIVDVAMFVGCDVHAVDPEFAVVDSGVAVGELDFVSPQRFDLGPGQYDTDLESVEDFVLMPGFTVLSDILDAGIIHDADDTIQRAKPQ